MPAYTSPVLSGLERVHSARDIQSAVAECIGSMYSFVYGAAFLRKTDAAQDVSGVRVRPVPHKEI